LVSRAPSTSRLPQPMTGAFQTMIRGQGSPHGCFPGVPSGRSYTQTFCDRPKYTLDYRLHTWHTTEANRFEYPGVPRILNMTVHVIDITLHTWARELRTNLSIESSEVPLSSVVTCKLFLIPKPLPSHAL
jgi:hypothetical protein